MPHLIKRRRHAEKTCLFGTHRVPLVLPASYAAEPLYRGYAILTEPPIAPTSTRPSIGGFGAKNVLEGLREILHGTGYRLADPAAADPAIGRLYDQPYPDGQREIGPRELGAVLERLAGAAWQLVEDPVNRRVSFEVKRPTAHLKRPVDRRR